MTDFAALIARLDDLIVQATRERSHYYVASIAKESRDRIAALEQRIERQSVLLNNAVIANAKVQAERDALRDLLRSIVADLPTNRDWLDPAIERAANAALAGAKVTPEQSTP